MKKLRRPVTVPRATFVLGGARSGKSAFAERLVKSMSQSVGEEASPSPVYIATAQAFDDEMAARIAQHQADRGADWETIDAPLDAPSAINAATEADRVVLVDCLTLWLSNLMLAGYDVDAETDAMVSALASAKGPIVAVSNEVGLGIVPDNALARRFRDAQGRLNQKVAAASDLVVFTAAGLPMVLKGALPA